MRFLAVTERNVIGVNNSGVLTCWRILRSFSPRAACGLADIATVFRKLSEKLIGLGAGSAHELAPFVDFVADECAEPFRRTRDRLGTEREHAFFHLGGSHELARIRGNLVNDLRRGST